MSIQGKKEGICRIVGSLLILIGLILSLILDYFILNNPLLYLFVILIVVPPFILSILLKLERDFIVDNSSKLLLLLVIESIVLSALIFAFDIFLIINFFITVSSLLMLISSWHFSLSIYRINKLIFHIGGFGYFILNIFFWLEIFNLDTTFIFNLIPLVITLLGFLLIIVAELKMKKKGLLNYI